MLFIIKKVEKIFYEKKEDLQEQARKKYRYLFNEVNDTKRKHGRNQRRNMSKEDKQKQKQMK